MLKKALFAAFAFVFFAGCHNDLDILAPYKESVSVYGLLNQDDTVQYIRVGRVFLGEGNAITMAGHPDSAYYKPGELKVSLQRLKNGIPVSVDAPATANMEIVLTETYLPVDSTGIFNANQLIYKTNHAIFEDSQYKLLIHNNRTGADFSSKNVNLVGDFTSKMIYGQQGSQITSAYAPVHFCPNGTVKCKYQAPNNSGVCGLMLRFYYTEYPAATGPGTATYKDFELGIQYSEQSGGTDEIDLSYSGNTMINNVLIAITDNGTIHHRVADSMRFYMNAAGPDLALYNQVNGTSTMSQDKPYYTNINGGVGLFSARRYHYVRKQVATQAKDRLASHELTCPTLHFYGAAGTFLVCQ